MGLATSKDSDGLIDRLDGSRILSSAHKLKTDFLVEIDGKQTIVDTAKLPHSVQNEATRGKVDALMKCYDSLMEELISCATEGFDECLHQKKPWSKIARANRSNASAPTSPPPRRSSAATPPAPVSPDETPAKARPSTYETTHSNIDPALGDMLSETYLDEYGNSMARRKLIVDDAFRLGKGDRLLFCGKKEHYNMSMFPLPLNVREFRRGDDMYLQCTCEVENNMNGHKYLSCSSANKEQLSNLLLLFKQGDGISLDGVNVLIKYSDVLNGKCELWDVHNRMPFRSYTQPLIGDVKTSTGRGCILSKKARTKLALVRNVLSLMRQYRNEIWGDRLEMLLLAGVMADLKATCEISVNTAALKSFEKEVSKLNNPVLSLSAKELVKEVETKGVDWCEKYGQTLMGCIESFFKEGFSSSNSPISQVEDGIKTLSLQCPLLWSLSMVALPKRAKHRAKERGAKDTIRLILCVSMLRARCKKLMPQFGLILRLSAMSDNTSDHAFMSFLGLESSKSHTRNFMNDNYEALKAMQDKAMKKFPRRQQSSDNYQEMRPTVFQDNGRSCIPVHGTITSEVKPRSALWKPGDIIGFTPAPSDDGPPPTHEFKVKRSKPADAGHYEIWCEAEALGDCDVLLGSNEKS